MVLSTPMITSMIMVLVMEMILAVMSVKNQGPNCLFLHKRQKQFFGILVSQSFLWIFAGFNFSCFKDVHGDWCRTNYDYDVIVTSKTRGCHISSSGRLDLFDTRKGLQRHVDILEYLSFNNFVSIPFDMCS